jgi:serine/threonine protein phosphatase PrpC
MNPQVIYTEQQRLESRLHEFPGGAVAVFSVCAADKTGVNEDSVALLPVDENRGLIVVADGVGGQAAGYQASRIAVEELGSVIKVCNGGGIELREAVLQGIDRANRKILALGTGSATTIVVAELDHGVVRNYHVGDSILLVTGQRGRLKRLTIAHSPVGYGLESGLLDEIEAMASDERHIVSNVVGCTDMRIEVGPRLKLARYDTLLLASDGLSDNLVVDDIINHIRTGALQQAASALMDDCLSRMAAGGHIDDLTVVLFRPEPDAKTHASIAAQTG